MPASTIITSAAGSRGEPMRDAGARLVRAVFSKTWSSMVVGALWTGGHLIRPPRPITVILEILLILLIVAMAHGLVHWTRQLGGLPRVIEVAMRVAAWSLIVSLDGLYLVARPAVGVLGGALIVYMAYQTCRESADRVLLLVLRKVRFSDVALRPDHPRYRPAVVAPFRDRRR